MASIRDPTTNTLYEDTVKICPFRDHPHQISFPIITKACSAKRKLTHNLRTSFGSSFRPSSSRDIRNTFHTRHFATITGLTDWSVTFLFLTMTADAHLAYFVLCVGIGFLLQVCYRSCSHHFKSGVLMNENLQDFGVRLNWLAGMNIFRVGFRAKIPEKIPESCGSESCGTETEKNTRKNVYIT